MGLQQEDRKTDGIRGEIPMWMFRKTEHRLNFIVDKKYYS